ATTLSATSASAVWSRSDDIGWRLVYAVMKIITRPRCGCGVDDSSAPSVLAMTRRGGPSNPFPALQQRLVNHAGRSRAQHDLLTRILKPITTALRHCHGNRAATVRGEFEFRGVKWKPAGSLPGRGAPGGCPRGSSPSSCP